MSSRYKSTKRRSYMKNFIALLIGFFCLAILSGCSTSPQNKIARRWVVSDVYGDADQKRRFAERQEDRGGEIEFSKDGKILIYEKGVLDEKGTYTLAPDGQSLIYNNDGSTRQNSFKIVTLTSTKFEFVPVGETSDTIICIVKP